MIRCSNGWFRLLIMHFRVEKLFQNPSQASKWWSSKVPFPWPSFLLYIVELNWLCYQVTATGPSQQCATPPFWLLHAHPLSKVTLAESKARVSHWWCHGPFSMTCMGPCYIALSFLALRPSRNILRAPVHPYICALYRLTYKMGQTNRQIGGAHVYGCTRCTR